MSNFYCLHLEEYKVIATTITNVSPVLLGVDAYGSGILTVDEADYSNNNYLDKLFDNGVFVDADVISI